MNAVPIELIRQPPTKRQVVSGFALIGERSAAWMASFLNDSASAAVFERFAFYRLPKSACDNRSLGLVALPTTPSAPPRQATPGIHASGLPDSAGSPSLLFPVGAVALVPVATGHQSSLWIASDSQLSPSLPEERLLSMLPADMVCVWLASTGLIGFEPSDRWQLHDLVTLPATFAPEQAWHSPPDTVMLPQRLSGFSLQRAPDWQAMFHDESQTIGNQSDALGQGSDPSLTGPFQSFVRKLIARLRRKPEDATPPATGSDEQRSWLNEKWQQMLASKWLESKRDAQLQKLVDMMDRNPDHALQYALPLGGDGSFRGLSTPGSELTSQRPDFSLGGLGGDGGPADLWQIDNGMRVQLQHAYRRQANRESALGRHRRAAYIYAHLLGDYASAARVLEVGEYWSEAAELYARKLRRPNDAARCHVAAGQFAAAAEIHEQQNDYVAAAEVWQRTGDESRAKNLFQQAVRRHIANGKPILAAGLLDSRLQAREEATELLIQQWPGGHEPARALKQVFDWWAEAGQHDRTRELLSELTQTPQADSLTLATITADLATRYPDHAVRQLAADRCRVAVASGNQQASPYEMQQRMAQLRRLASDDVLLDRDVTRYLHRQPQVAPPRRAISSGGQSSTAEIPYLGKVGLPAAERYLKAHMVRGELLAVGTAGYKLQVVRLADLAGETPRHETCQLQLGQPLALAHHCAIHTATDHVRTRIEMYFGGSTPVYFRSEPIPSPFQETPWWLATPTTLANIHDGGRVAVDSSGVVWTLAASDEGLVLREIHPPANSVQSYAMSEPLHTYLRASPLLHADAPSSIQTENLHLTCVDSTPLAVVDNLVCAIKHGVVDVRESIPGSVHGIAASLPHTRRRLALAHASGVALWWMDNRPASSLQIIERGEPHQHVAFLHGARLAAIAGRQLTLYQVRTDLAKRVGQATLRAKPIVELLSLSAECCGVLYADGTLDRYRTV